MAQSGVTQRVQWVDANGNIIGTEMGSTGMPLEVSSETLYEILVEILEELREIHRTLGTINDMEVVDDG